MTLPLQGSMNYLIDGGVLDFDANAYLNTGITTPYYQPMLNGVKMQSQPQQDSFSSKIKNKLSDKNTLKTIAATAILGILAFVGIKKSKTIFNNVKNSKLITNLNKGFNSVKNWVKDIPNKISKILPKKENIKNIAEKTVDTVSSAIK